jgi:predicted component of viral defense system (DUF524 family)
VASVVVPTLLAGEAGRFSLSIAALPGKHAPDERSAEEAGRAIRLFEGEEYRYQWIGPAGALVTEPRELFQPDTLEGRSGRLRTGLSVGFIEAALSCDGLDAGSLELEVRSRKLQYEDEYQWMLRDIAGHMTELVMERFAASDLRFTQDESRDAATLYQRFEFLRALLKSERFTGAIQEVIHSPHAGWEEQFESVPLGAGFVANAQTAKQLARVGFRPRTEGMRIQPSSKSQKIERRRTEATQDTTPNRFVKHALEHWLLVLGEIENALLSAKPTAPVVRGRAEVAATAAELEQLLHADIFRSVGRLKRFPSDDQVLQKREGYRDVFRAYLEFELGALLSWDALPTSHMAGARNVATLYEYWAFVELARSVADVAGATFELAPLLRLQAGGLSIGIRKGRSQVFSGDVSRHGRDLKVELWFNRTYSTPEKSWTLALRPDYSLIIRPVGDPGGHEHVMLHFDAKYRVQFIQQLYGILEGKDDSEEVGETESIVRGNATQDDLLKMHAYRDAIRRTSGAYVLYPGGDAEVDKKPLREYHELLPGLGAFVLRPTEDGGVVGDGQLREFISQVVDHAALRFTQHERDRYWHDQVYGDQALDQQLVLRREVSGPPPTASVLLGFVKDSAHWTWIERTRSYNLRSSGRLGGVEPESALLQSQLVLLYCPETSSVRLARLLADPELVSRKELVASRYPRPGGEAYWCVQIGWVGQPNWLEGITAAGIVELLGRHGLVYGAPALMSWAELRQGLPR